MAKGKFLVYLTSGGRQNDQVPLDVYQVNYNKQTVDQSALALGLI